MNKIYKNFLITMGITLLIGMIYSLFYVENNFNKSIMILFITGLVLVLELMIFLTLSIDKRMEENSEGGKEE